LHPNYTVNINRLVALRIGDRYKELFLRFGKISEKYSSVIWALAYFSTFEDIRKSIDSYVSNAAMASFYLCPSRTSVFDLAVDMIEAGDKKEYCRRICRNVNYAIKTFTSSQRRFLLSMLHEDCDMRTIHKRFRMKIPEFNFCLKKILAMLDEKFTAIGMDKQYFCDMNAKVLTEYANKYEFNVFTEQSIE